MQSEGPRPVQAAVQGSGKPYQGAERQHQPVHGLLSGQSQQLFPQNRGVDDEDTGEHAGDEGPRATRQVRHR